MSLKNDFRNAIEAAIASGAKTPDEIQVFVAERLAPIAHVEVMDRSQKDRDERRVTVIISLASPSGSTH